MKEREKESRISWGGKVSGPVGVSPGVHSFWTGKEKEGGGSGQQHYDVGAD